MDAKLQKLKVAELKELLSKHNLPQTGKKDELVKRLVENNISTEEGDEELLDPDDVETDQATAPTSSAVPAASTLTSAGEMPEKSTDPTNGSSVELTPEQQAMKARAERFGMPYNPNASSRSGQKSGSGSEKATAQQPHTPASSSTSQAQKAGPIDKAPLGVSEETLAKRAAKFGLPEKTSAAATAPAAESRTKAASTPAPPKAEAEMTPELKEKIAIEEEKKRKRAEKFGTAQPTNGTAAEPDAKKTKV
ncbi:hypothetical protein BD324DRAFT_611512 [Kockovaella imperatae]|uniref:SAP domain-containing protein n=1 Tax=Kockovaella imperatae TaxID=4999 RepID=A0A1Y1URD8_9TREE|nr:hypothetical protein BD324DRAFT_611512 [Kockovaella imperatae]ORX40610.1 hypothetical protein BD324DRAFT_611512 [Kockovaella imperatae]